MGARGGPQRCPRSLTHNSAAQADYVVENARRKAIETTERLRSASEAGKALLVIGSDTVVVHDGAILEKPRSEDEARRMLRSLAGTGHEVFTGVALVHVGADGREDTHAFSERTEVEFGAVTDAAIDGAWGGTVAVGEGLWRRGGRWAGPQRRCSSHES